MFRSRFWALRVLLKEAAVVPTTAALVEMGGMKPLTSVTSVSKVSSTMIGSLAKWLLPMAPMPMPGDTPGCIVVVATMGSAMPPHLVENVNGRYGFCSLTGFLSTRCVREACAKFRQEVRQSKGWWETKQGSQCDYTEGRQTRDIPDLELVFQVVQRAYTR